MDLGEKLRLARLEAGLSQRQLCGDAITRNMLSQIEHGTAGPSMATLRYLADRLGRPLSYFLDEAGTLSPNQGVMETARQCFDAGNWAGAVDALDRYQRPDALFDREAALLGCLAGLNLAEEAQQSGRDRYARDLLEGMTTEGVYCAAALERRRLLLLGKPEGLPSLDEELLLRAEKALDQGNSRRAGKLLDAAEDQSSPRWQLLQGMSCLAQKSYAAAVPYFQQAEEAFPHQAVPCLEVCFRELGDYQQAYVYACKRADGHRRPGL